MTTAIKRYNFMPLAMVNMAQQVACCYEISQSIQTKINIDFTIIT
ncbi:hypothetical protein M917_2412 [Psychrobacter aquaticus CMS 56]|uniref:Uncharacterized protein n=1 Tax=Psychrobacter aquaticus CMS 56 TaxID=1354303 RepID=U4T4K0_9GAMM|nr:hypothetical protein M917_2412 [Psychrobacter aquaticus CMS 56]